MPYLKHRHFWRLVRAHNHPPGYLFTCRRCEKQDLYPFHFISKNEFWKGLP